MRKSKKAKMKWIRLDNIMDKGIINLGKAAFLIKVRLSIIEGVVFVTETEK